MRSLILLLPFFAACSPADVRSGNPLALLSPYPPTEHVTAFIGQSNCNQAHNVGPTTVPSEAEVWHNGDQLFTYPALFGPQADYVDQMVTLGYAPTVVSRCSNGNNIATLMGYRFPELVTDLDTLGLVPDDVVIVHGEQDATLSSLAVLYGVRLHGPAPSGEGPSLLDLIYGEWPDARVLITEVRVRADGAFPYHDWTRTAQHDAALFSPSSCLVPTLDCELRTGTNQPHYSQAGLYCLGSKLADEVDDGTCL